MNDAILSSALKEIDLSEKVRNELVDRMIIDFDRGAGLLDNPVIDKEDSVTHGHGFRLIMSNIDNCDSKRGCNILNLESHGFTQFGIQVGKRLIQKQNFRFGNKRSGQGNALLLPAGKLVWKSVNIFCKMNSFQDSGYFVFDFLFADMLNLKRVGNIIKHIHMRPDRI